MLFPRSSKLSRSPTKRRRLDDSTSSGESEVNGRTDSSIFYTAQANVESHYANVVFFNDMYTLTDCQRRFFEEKVKPWGRQWAQQNPQSISPSDIPRYLLYCLRDHVHDEGERLSVAAEFRACIAPLCPVPGTAPRQVHILTRSLVIEVMKALVPQCTYWQHTNRETTTDEFFILACFFIVETFLEDNYFPCSEHEGIGLRAMNHLSDKTVV